MTSMLKSGIPPALRSRLRNLRHGDQSRQWARLVMDKDLEQRLEALPNGASVVEVSGHLPRTGSFDYEQLNYPEFDLCDGKPVHRTFDVVISHQVIEHVPDPFVAVQKLHALTAPGGWAYVSSVLLVRIHPCPDDYWRFTPSGMRVLMERAGFSDIELGQWGNRRAVWSNLRVWRPVRAWTPWRTLGNRWDVPVVVWAVGRR